MKQAIESYRELAITCASPLANAISLKEIINLINRQSKNFTSLQTCLISKLALFKKFYIVDGKTSKQFDKYMGGQATCFNCSKMGHFKLNCSYPKKPFVPRTVQHLLNDPDAVFEEAISELDDDSDPKNC